MDELFVAVINALDAGMTRDEIVALGHNTTAVS